MATTQPSEKPRKRLYEFVTTEEFYGKPVSEVTSRAVWEGFEANTSAHGIPNVRNARGKYLINLA